jgi:hypothetical protein
VTTWETAFVATSVVLGLPADEAVDSLDSTGARRAAPFVSALSAPSRTSRAKALASAVAAIAVDIERARLA